MEAYDYCGSSILLKHELLYALGQISEDKADIFKEFLIKVVNDPAENALSRHEAAEALANYFFEGLAELYEKHLNSTCKELKSTCEIAIMKVKEK